MGGVSVPPTNDIMAMYMWYYILCNLVGMALFH